MKKFFLVIIIILSFQSNCLLSEFYFNCFPPMELHSLHQFMHLVIDNNTDFDSINTVINNSLKEKKYKYFTLGFDKMNESSIDSLIKCLDNKNKIISVDLYSCPIKKLPIYVRKFSNLYSLTFENCDSIQSLNGFNTDFYMFSLFFENCRIKELPEGIEKLKSMLMLMLEFPDDFNEFDLNNELSKFTKRKNIINLFIKYKQLKEFPESLFELISLQRLFFLSNDSIYCPNKFDKLPNLNTLILTKMKNKEIETNSSFPEDTIEYWSLKNNLRFSVSTGSDYIEEPKWHIEKTYLYPYQKVASSVQKFEFEGYELTMTADTVKNHLTLYAPNIKETDTVEIYLVDYNKRDLQKTYKFNKDGTIFDLNEFPDGWYYYIISINNKQLGIWSIINKFK